MTSVIETVRQRINPSKAKSAPKIYAACYGNISPEDLLTSNYPDRYFRSYSVPVEAGKDFAYGLNIYGVGQWGSDVHLVPGVEVTAMGSREGITKEEALDAFVNLTKGMNRILGAKGRSEWDIKVRGTIMQSTVDISPSESKGSDGVFSKVREVVDFLREALPANGLAVAPDTAASVYYAGMSLEELESCNFPEFTRSGFFEQAPLRKFH